MGTQNITNAGTKGKPIQVEVNYFPMEVKKIINEAFHYDLVFTPPGPKKLIIKALEVFRQQFFKNFVFAFDGAKNVYTNKRLDKDELEETVEFKYDPTDEKPRKWKIKIAYATTVDLSILKE